MKIFPVLFYYSLICPISQVVSVTTMNSVVTTQDVSVKRTCATVYVTVDAPARTKSIAVSNERMKRLR